MAAESPAMGNAERTAPPASRDAWPKWVAIVATLAACAPMIFAILQVVGRSAHVLGDAALIDLAVKSVWSRHPPLVGVYSRVGFYHPGPALFYALAPFSLLSGVSTSGTVAGCACLEAIAVAWSARLAWRIGRLQLVLAVLAVQTLSLFAIRDFDPFTFPWNPSVALPYLPVLLLMLYEVSTGEARQTPWVLLVSTFIVQTHAGYGLLVVAGLVWLAVAVWRSRALSIRDWGRGGKIAALLAGALWVPPLIDEVHGSGNLGKLLKYFALHRKLPTFFYTAPTNAHALGFVHAARLWAEQFKPFPPWLGGAADSPTKIGVLTESAEAAAVWALVPLGLIALAFVLLWRRGRGARPLLGAFTLMVLVGYLSLAQVRDGEYSFAFFWYYTIAVAVVLVAIGAVVTLPAIWTHRPARVASAVVLAAAIAIPTGAQARRVITRASSTSEKTDVMARLVAQLHKPPASTRLILAGDLGWSIEVLDILRDRGFDVGVNTYLSKARLDNRYRLKSARNLVWVVANGVELSKNSQYAGAQVLVYTSPLTPSQEQTLRKDQSAMATELLRRHLQLRDYLLDSFDVASRFRDVPGLDQALLHEIGRLDAIVQRSGRLRIGIVAFDQDHIPKGY